MLGYLTSDVAVEAGTCAVQAEGVGVVLLIAWLLLAEVFASRFGSWAERRCIARTAVPVSNCARSGDGSAVGRSGGSVEELVGGMRYRNLTNPWRIAACVAAGVIGVWMLAWGDSLVAAGLALAMVLVMAEAVRCDVAHRLVPRELCALMAVVGGAFQLLAFGWAAFAGALVFAACAIALCCALSFFVRRLSDEEAAPPLGGGDVRCIGAIAIATGKGAFLALGAGAIAAALFCTVRFVVCSPNRRKPIPLAPFLMLGLMVGLVACL